MEMAVVQGRTARRGDVCLIQLDPRRGSEIRKTRPCLIISPDELNRYLRTLVVAPMTTVGHEYPWRVTGTFQNRNGFVAIDQVRTIDKERIAKRLGQIHRTTLQTVLRTLQEMFSL